MFFVLIVVKWVVCLVTLVRSIETMIRSLVNIECARFVPLKFANRVEADKSESGNRL